MNHSAVARSGKVGWIASLMKQLLEEVRIAPVGVAARGRIAAIHDCSVNRLERGLARDVVKELEGIAVPFCGQRRLHTGSAAAQGRGVSRIDRLLDNIEISQRGQQRQRHRRADAVRATKAAMVQYPEPVGGTRGSGDSAYDDPANYLG